MNILFIDDDELRTRPLNDALKHAGHSVTFEQIPLNGKRLFEENPDKFDVIVIDIMMPHHDIPAYRDFAIPKFFPSNHDGMFTGLKLYSELEAIKIANNLDTYVIILTCVSDIEKYTKAIDLTPSKILFKPIYIDDFIREVGDVI
ncbi:MAG: response regulator transcription factor [FCB group bacterium]|nr:response regulator transcription factor [FCB group bacterium]